MNENSRNLFGYNVIRSLSFDQNEIISNILKLHCNGAWIDLDPTYSTGNFYSGGISVPRFKFDISPSTNETIKADASFLPIKDNSIKIIMFDPPFIIGSRKDGKPGIIKERFGYFRTMPGLLMFYDKCLREFSRIMLNKGTLIFKCQDCVDSTINYFSHIEIFNSAIRHKLIARDLFVYAVKNRMETNIKTQRHARKYHSYFWVFEKLNSRN